MSLSSSSSSLACVRPDRVEGKKKSISKKHLYRSKASRETRLIRLFIIFCKRDMTIHTQCVRARIPEMSTKYVHWPCPQVGPHSSELYNGTRKSYTLYYYYIPLIYVCVCVQYAYITIHIYIPQYHFVYGASMLLSWNRTGGDESRGIFNFSTRLQLQPRILFPRWRSLIPRSFRSIVKRRKKKRQISSHFL